MNMTSNLNTLSAAPFRSVMETVKIQPRERVLEKLPAVLVPAMGISHAVAAVAAGKVYDLYLEEVGMQPANAEAIRLWATKGGKAAVVKLLESLKVQGKVMDVPAVAEHHAPVTATKVAPTSNDKLDDATVGQLNQMLLSAYRDDAALDAALMEVRNTCVNRGQTYFVCAFRNWTKVSGRLIARLRAQGGGFGLYWTEGGWGEEHVPVRGPKGLTDAEYLRLTEALRAAVRNGTNPAVDFALRDIVDSCKAAGDWSFLTPYQNHTLVSGRLIGRLLARGMMFGLYWSELGLWGEDAPVQAAKPTAPAKVKPTRAELDARRQTNRAQRLADQPKKGPTSGKTGPGKGK